MYWSIAAVGRDWNSSNCTPPDNEKDVKSLLLCYFWSVISHEFAVFKEA